jgi:hypothetical protein
MPTILTKILRGAVTKRERRMLAKSGKTSGEFERKPAADGGPCGAPPSVLRQVSAVVAHGTMASAGRALGAMAWGDATRQQKVMGLALAQMWAQAQLMGAVLGGNQLIAQFMHSTR